MKTGIVLTAVLMVMGGKPCAAGVADLQAMKASDIEVAAADIAVPPVSAYQEQRQSPVYDIWVAGEAICAAHAEHLVAKARAAFEKQYEPRLKKEMQKVYLAQGFNKITAVTFIQNEQGNFGMGRTYRVSAPGNRDDSTNVTVWHSDEIESDEMWADSIHGIVLQKLDLLKRDKVNPRVVCALYPGEAYVSNANDSVFFTRFDPPSHVFEMDLDGANLRASKATSLNDAYTRFYGPME